MRVVVLVKHVPEPTAAWRFTDDHTLDRDGVEGRLSQLDEYAIEQAVKLTEAGVGAEITCLTMGPAKAADALRKALAMGGEKGVHVLDDALHGSDALATSLVLAKALERVGFDLVLCGMASTDAEMSVMPGLLAARLGVPSASNASDIRVDNGTAVVHRDTDPRSRPSWPPARSRWRPGRWPTSGYRRTRWAWRPRALSCATRSPGHPGPPER